MNRNVKSVQVIEAEDFALRVRAAGSERVRKLMKGGVLTSGDGEAGWIGPATEGLREHEAANFTGNCSTLCCQSQYIYCMVPVRMATDAWDVVEWMGTYGRFGL